MISRLRSLQIPLAVLLFLACVPFGAHAQNLVNYGILPLVFEDPGDWADIRRDDVLRFDRLRSILPSGRHVTVRNLNRDRTYRLVCHLSPRQLQMVLAGGLINAIRDNR